MANILAVDDEKAILNMIESILVKDSHTVTKIDEPTKIEMDKLSPNITGRDDAWN